MQPKVTRLSVNLLGCGFSGFHAVVPLLDFLAVFVGASKFFAALEDCKFSCCNEGGNGRATFKGAFCAALLLDVRTSTKRDWILAPGLAQMEEARLLFNDGVTIFELCAKTPLLPLLPPVRLNLLNKQHLVAIGVGAVVYTDMGKDVGLVPVG